MKRMSPKKYAEAQAAKIRLKKIMPVFRAYCGIVKSSSEAIIKSRELQAESIKLIEKAGLKHRDFCEDAICLGYSASDAQRVFELLIMDHFWNLIEKDKGNGND